MPFTLPLAIETFLAADSYLSEDLNVLDSMLHNLTGKEKEVYMHDKVFWRLVENLFRV